MIINKHLFAKQRIVRKCFFVALLLLCCLAFSACTKNVPLAEPPAPIEEEPATSEPIFGENDLVWRIEPVFDSIFYCGICGFSTEDHGGEWIDAKTGQPTEPRYPGHGGEADYFYYDETKELYCYFTNGYSGDYLFLGSENDFSDFLEKQGYSNQLLAFQKIDSDRIKDLGPDYYDPLTKYDLSDANISEKYALAYGTKFVSDFIYYNDARYNLNYFFKGVKNIIAMRLNDKWGILDVKGNIVIPFEFEDIILIDEETAFAKYNGKYGILDIIETSP